MSNGNTTEDEMLDRIDARRQVEVAMQESRERIARLLGRLPPNVEVLGPAHALLADEDGLVLCGHCKTRPDAVLHQGGERDG